ncbi:ribosomal protein L2 [Trichosporon asahii var. asahii CBS 8904]|uniref:Ribosomal protein L2 n=1 Tax=Trichosporon asahii var. asahii (strain CBS 8904) TaxID=1220162 RepID=K1VVN6_TRIAC|nr:ribosomal protein L2 [Trichosporon asahii var. asahii CBS 8904]
MFRAALRTRLATVPRAPLVVPRAAAQVRFLATPVEPTTDIETPAVTPRGLASEGVEELLGPRFAEEESTAIIKRYRGKGFPMIPSLRHRVHVQHPHLFDGKPLRALTLAKRKKGGRNSTGQVVNRGVGGGHKQRIRIVDFYRLEHGVHDVVRIEYDPGRSGHIALIKRRGGADVSPEEGAALAEASSELPGGSTEKRLARNEVKGGWSYILAPDGLRAGDTVESFRGGVPDGFVEGWANPHTTEIVGGYGQYSTAQRALGVFRSVAVKPGNVLPLSLIPPGTVIHNLTINPDGRMALCRSAGTYATLVAHQQTNGEPVGGAEVLTLGGGLDSNGIRARKNGDAIVRLSSGEIRRLDPENVATIGMVSNKEHHLEVLGKAGRNRWLGKRPKVRGIAMNACDHPHGGGRGKSKGGKHPRSAKGVLQGKRTRRPRDRDGNKAVIQERPRGAEKRRS